MKRTSVILFILLCATVSVQAQGLRFGGAVLNHDLILSSDFVSLSQTQNFGTSRSMAMGGAFTSLGADMASMSQNPAGLGMYLRNEISLTPMTGVANASTAGTDSWSAGSNSRTRFSFANIGAALNVYESSRGALTSLTLGFGVNRIADFNNRYSFSSESRYDPSRPDDLMPTIADIFGQQLGQGNVYPQPGEDGNPNGKLGYNINPYLWPAVMGYNGYMISVNDDGLWGSDCIGRNASVLHSLDVINSGSINEFTVSLGANINNFLYIGGSLGIQSVYKRTQVTYQEEYGYFNSDGYALDRDGNTLPQQLEYANIWQQSVLSGSGVNFKLGAIVRPVAGLRIGVAFHTPTFYSLDRTYRGNIQSHLLSNTNNNDLYADSDTPVQRDEGPNSWEFVSPSRLMFGASYTFGRFAIVSVDYERDWYNGIRVKNVPDGADFNPDFYKAEIKNNFCGTNTLRAGVEVRPLPMLALRVGGGFTTSLLNDKELWFNMPLTTKSHYITAGVGLTLSRTVVLDLAYQNLTQTQTQYQLFFSMEPDGSYTDNGFFDTKQTRHFISMTLGFRF